MFQVGASCPTHWVNQHLAGEEEGASLLELAVKEGRYKEAEVLVKVGALADQPGAASGLSPLHVAVKKGNLTMLKLLLMRRFGF